MTAHEHKKNTSNKKQGKKMYSKDVLIKQILKITALKYYSC